MSMKLIGVYKILCVVFLAFPIIVSAHATPITYTPKASETVLETPASISIRFTERIETGASSLSVYGPTGEKVNDSKGEIDMQDPRILFVPIEDGGEGVYTVSWQVVSVDDGHFTKGAYSFLVDSAGTPYEGEEEAVAVSYSTNIPDVVTAFLSLAGESLFAALLVFVLLSFVRKKELLHHTTITLCVIGGLSLFLFGSFVSIARKSSELASLQDTGIWDAVFVYASSSVGTLAYAKIALIIVCAYLFFALRKRHWHLLLVLLCILFSILLYLQSYISHAAASLFLPQVSILLTYIHLFAKECIVGCILVLCIAFFQRKGQYPALAQAFDKVFPLLLFAAVISGVYIVWLHLKHIGNLSLSNWGALFLLLLWSALFFGLFRVFHQFVVHPRLEKTGAVKIYMVTLVCEAAFALVVLFFSAYVSMTTPPFTVEAFTFSREETIQDIRMHLDVHPYQSQMLRLVFSNPTTGQNFDPQSITLTAEQVALGIGPNVLSLQKLFEGGYAFPTDTLSPAGQWKLSVTATPEQGYDANAQFVLNYPSDIAATRISDEVRVWDSFTHGTIVLGIILFVLCCAYLAFAQRRAALPTPLLASVPYHPVYALMSVVILCCIGGLLIFLYQTPFQRHCEQDGNVWKVAYPAYNFEATSKNAQLGCTVHDGHFHFIDEREYQFHKSISP